MPQDLFHGAGQIIFSTIPLIHCPSHQLHYFLKSLYHFSVSKVELLSKVHSKNLGRFWLAYAELQVEFTCYNSNLLTLVTLHSQTPLFTGKGHRHLLNKVPKILWLDLTQKLNHTRVRSRSLDLTQNITEK